ncbi:sugar ABC transporter permease [Anabaena sp. UHCC 0253]|uniref:sugar ABC transporter permease n=1 Tax=Anabaena sp. UHCC 0253 TaxID=2590019 RepID=UPI0014473BC0|nr:sugar ABC transporter permease [Anabaena sp. UHCC 0253]MTJ53029.1 sugar ABC transporter permease [Anabaena sp. UHCC 0253]
MTSTSNVEIIIYLAELGLEQEELQAEVQKLLPILREVDGVETADIVTVEKAPVNTKAVGGFVWELLTTKLNPANIKPLFGFLTKRFGNTDKKVKVKITRNNGNLDGLELEIGDAKDLEATLKAIQDFLENTK